MQSRQARYDRRFKGDDLMEDLKVKCASLPTDWLELVENGDVVIAHWHSEDPVYLNRDSLIEMRDWIDSYLKKEPPRR